MWRNKKKGKIKKKYPKDSIYRERKNKKKIVENKINIKHVKNEKFSKHLSRKEMKKFFFFFFFENKVTYKLSDKS